MSTRPSVAATSGHAAPIYFVNDIGLIKQFSGIDTGAHPVTAGSFAIGAGVLVATVPAYGEYQGFTYAPTGEVIAVNPGGDIVEWTNVNAWLANSTPTTLAADVFADKGNGNGPAGGNNAGAGTIHGLSYDGNTGGYYVTLEGDTAYGGDGDIREYASLDDLLTNTGTTTASSYGGNLLNFYYGDEDAPGSAAAPNDIAGANYFQIGGNGTLEGHQTLADYIASPGSRTYDLQPFGAGLRGGFAVPEPSTAVLSVIAVGGLLFLRRYSTNG
ncbi:PEP-CTERM sorting domain-containing protein [Aeoliella mucimassa]|uniref:PEP-CTERM protein-sorting domain-containing protein n=1 Tax=Aeoliella mucimassa TaxID=2527972 RepID=A0A518APD5_9BACT|nr:PEP-CTERM sorting domain-containing protein [Aeoliella mucimassa]QDU56590.1 hypothetical protein Pan181_28000 [Aeoliella mucimassa]